MSNIKIGWSMRDVSTTEAVNIPGQFHMRISKGIKDPLTATALVLRDGDNNAIFLSLDVGSIRCGLYDEVISKTKEKAPEIPAEILLMGGTHTHTGASYYYDSETFAGTASQKDIDDSGIASSEGYRDFLTDMCSDAIVEAWNKTEDGGVAWGYGYAVVAHSRRTVYLEDVSGGAASGFTVNGHAVMYGNTNDPRFAGYESGSDHFVNLLYTFDTRGNLTGAIVNVPCPSQNSEHEYTLSADYWHDVRAELKRRHGDIFVLAQCAAAGDLSPRILHYKQAQKRRFALKYGMGDASSLSNSDCERLDIAERIADAFDEVLEWARKDIRTEAVVRHEMRDLKLSRRIITEEDYKFAAESLERLGEVVPKTDGTPRENLDYNSKCVSERNRFKAILARYEMQKTRKHNTMRAHFIRVGDIAFASNQYELYMDFQHRIQARSPFEQTFIVQLAGVPGGAKNDYIGIMESGGTYLATTKGAANKGYSATLFCNHISPEGGQELVELSLDVLNELFESVEK